MTERQKKINELNKQIQDLRYAVIKLEEEEQAEKKPYKVWMYREVVKEVLVQARDTDEALEEARKIAYEFPLREYDGFTVQDATFVVGGVIGKQ